MMEDKGLLELAAKAAGYVVRWYEDSMTYGPTFGIEVEPGNPCGFEPWNPLEDDGDALRLAAVLGMKVGILHGEAKSTYVSRWVSDNRATTVERHGEDMMAATRRAIVRDAAEIGRTK